MILDQTDHVRAWMDKAMPLRVDHAGCERAKTFYNPRRERDELICYHTEDRRDVCLCCLEAITDETVTQDGHEFCSAACATRFGESPWLYQYDDPSRRGL